jgi:hypothetical protein
MNRTQWASSVDGAESFDTLARTLTERFPRRRVFGLVVATLVTGVLGTAVHAPEAAARKKGGRGEHCGRRGGRCAPPTFCSAEGNSCSTLAGQQGQCRRPAPADNQPGFVCTSFQAGNSCTSSAQCGDGTRCMVDVAPAGQTPALTCRIVIA